jgi:hypothetical protein
MKSAMAKNGTIIKNTRRHHYQQTPPASIMVSSSFVLVVLPLFLFCTVSNSPTFTTEAFTTTTTTTTKTSTRTTTVTTRKRNLIQSTTQHFASPTLYDDFEDFFFPSENEDHSLDNNKNKKNQELPSDSDLYASLRARQASLDTASFSSTSSSSSYSTTSFPNEQQEQEQQQQTIRYNWKEANCVSLVRLTLEDWIRRLAIDLYPLVVCGSARGNLYLADLERQEELDCLEGVHASHLDESVDQTKTPQDLNEALEVLYGNYDGGGVLAIAAHKDFIVSSGREGGVHVCTIVGTQEHLYTGSRGGKSQQTRLQLQPLGKLRGLEYEPEGPVYYQDYSPTRPLITSLAFDKQGTLWLGGYDGILRGYDYEQTDADDKPLMLRQKNPDHEINVGSPILSLTVNDDIGCGIIATESGIVLFSLDDGRILSSDWNPVANSRRGEYVRTAMIVQTDEPQPIDSEMLDESAVGARSGSGSSSFKETILPSSHWSVIVGCSKGSLFQRRLGINARTGFVSEQSPWLDTDESAGLGNRVRPNHLGPVVAMASPSPGLLVTGSHDGTMRVWDCSLYRTNKDEDDNEDDEDEDDEEQDDNTNLVKHNKGSRDPKRPRVLYALSGYKVWLGSIFANDRKLVSDGADNSIIVHSFDEDEEDVLRSREEDEDDSEDFTFD